MGYSKVVLPDFLAGMIETHSNKLIKKKKNWNSVFYSGSMYKQSSSK